MNCKYIHIAWLSRIIVNTCTQHGYSEYVLDCTQKHDLLSDRKYQVYSRYIPGIYYEHAMQRSLASQISCPSALPLDLLSFGHREAAHARLGSSKVPKPCVDLLNMASPPQGRACPIGNPQNSPSFCCCTYVE